MNIIRAGVITVIAVTTVNPFLQSIATPQEMPLTSSEGYVPQAPMAHNRFVGITSTQEALYATIENISESKGEIYSQDIETGLVKSNLPLTPLIDPYALLLSPDGSFLITHENPADLTITPAEAHRLNIFDSAQLKPIKSIDIGKGNDVVEMNFLNGSSERIVLQTLSAIPFKNDDFVYGKDRFVIFNLKTEKTEKVIPYARARRVDLPLFSPDEKYLVCVFYGEDEADHKGIIDVVDAQTGKILWHVEGSDTQPIGVPAFFISPTRFISSDTVFDIKNKTAHKWAVINDKRQFVSEVPGHSSYALFLTPNGTELRNWKTDTLVTNWPSLKKRGRITFAPDLKIMAYKQGQTVQFFKFDSAWLK